jgi:hypothetical protein
MTWSKREENAFDAIFNDIIKRTIDLDLLLSRAILYYFSRDSKLKEFNSELLEKEFFNLNKKKEIVCDITKIMLPQYNKGLSKKIEECLKIRNKLVHKKAVEEGWTEVGYIIKNTNGKEELKKMEQLNKDFYSNFKEILKVCTELTNLLRFKMVLEDIKHCTIEVQDAKNEKLVIAYISVKNSLGQTGNLYTIPKKYYNQENYEESIKEYAKEILYSHNSNVKNISYTMSVNWFKESIEPFESVE